MGIFNENKFSQIKKDQAKAKKHTILIVDDESANLSSIEMVLNKHYNLITAKDGQDALKLINADNNPERIHLIISDQRMPNLSGVDFLKATIPIIPRTIRMILTGFTDVDTIIDSINDGQIYKFITKPIDPQDLLVTVRRGLEAYELEAKNVELIESLRELNASLEQKVEERTRDLEQSRQKLAIKNEIMEEDLVIAGEVQKTIFPKIVPPPFLKIAMRFFPHSHVSGDIYYLTKKPNNDFDIFLGDATGHGVSAALSTIMANVALYEKSNEDSLCDILTYLNKLLEMKLPDDRFMTAVYLRISPTGKLRMLNAGHPEMIILPSDGSWVNTEVMGRLLGVFPTELLEFEEFSYQLQPGDRCFLYTDGITEAGTDEKEMLGPERLYEFLKVNQDKDLDSLLTDLMAFVQDYAEDTPPIDDVSIIALEYQP